MANALYDKYREKCLLGVGGVQWLVDTIKVLLVDTAFYTVNLAADEFLSDIPIAARIQSSTAIASKTATAGVADGADVLFTAVTGPSIEALVIYQDTGVVGTSQLIAYYDTVTGLPFTPSGADEIVQWSNGPSKIYKL